MNSLQRMMAAIRGEPFDRYPYINPYPSFSMALDYPALTGGLTWVHSTWGTDEERLRCQRGLYEGPGLDWIPAGGGPCGMDRRYRIEMDGAVPVLVDLETGARTRFEEPWKDMPPTERRFRCAREVEALPPPATAEAMLASDGFDFTRKVVAEMGDQVFLFGGAEAPFAACFRALTFEGLYETTLSDPSLLHAVAERAVESAAQQARALAKIGVHGMRINEYPAGAELLSESHYLEYVFPYNLRTIRAIRDAGLVAILEYLGWVEPRLPHIAKLEVDCLQTESSLKNYRNDVGTMRKALGEEVCLFSNSRILQVIEQGDEDVWRRDAVEQARGIGEQRRFAICAGSPTTRATGPERLRRYGEFMRAALAGMAPPLGEAQ